MRATYLGWLTYSNTAAPYRRWRIEENGHGMETGDVLHDRGPDCRGGRYALARGSEYVDAPAGAEIEDLHPFCNAPPWQPPCPDTLRLTEATEKLARAIQDLSTLDAIRKVVNGAGASTTGKSTKKEEESTPYLRLDHRGEYSSGAEYTVWELLGDVPEIRISERFGIEGKPHAQTGDRLWQEEDDLTPFKLKREGKRIASPEWWQVRHLFEGQPDAPTVEEIAPALAAFRRLVPGGLRHMWDSEDPGGVILGDAFRATEAIPAAGIRAGDFLVKVRGTPDKEEEDAMRLFTRISRSLFPTIREHLGVLQIVDGSYITGRRGKNGDPLAKLETYLGNKRVLRAKDESSPLFLVRPLRSEVSEPVRALSDDGAIFELIAQVGGRMPQEAGRE